ncbi:MAG: diphthamide synthesis protein [Candidatus Altiarchaeota archaeon]
MEYDLELERVMLEVRRTGAKRAGLQFPEGLKDQALDIAALVESSTKAKVIVLADPTYGACDLKRDMLKKLGIDLLIHFGHTRF